MSTYIYVVLWITGFWNAFNLGLAAANYGQKKEVSIKLKHLIYHLFMTIVFLIASLGYKFVEG